MAHYGAGDIVDYRGWEMHAVAGGRLLGAARDDGAAQIEVEARDRHDQPAREARADALVEHFEVARRRVAGHHHLLGAGKQRAQSMAEFGGRFALQELHVVDQQQVDPAQPFLEAERGLALHGGDEMVHEVVGGQIDDVLGRVSLLHLVGDGVEQMGFAQAHGRMDIDRVEAHGVVGHRLGDLAGDAQRHLVGAAGHEAVEGHARIDGAAGQGIALGGRIVAQHARLDGGNGGGLRLGGRGGFARGGGLGRILDQAGTGLTIDAQRDLDAAHLLGILTEGFQDPVAVIGLHPGAEKARGGGQVHHVLDDLLQLQPGEPGGEDILADPGLEAGANPVPQVALGFGRIGAGHDRCFALGRGKGGRGIGFGPIIPSGNCLSRHLECPISVRSVRPAKPGDKCPVSLRSGMRCLERRSLFFSSSHRRPAARCHGSMAGPSWISLATASPVASDNADTFSSSGGCPTGRKLNPVVNPARRPKAY